MKNIYIITNIFMDKTRKKLSVGGVETYVYNLCKVIKDMNLQVEVFQHSDIPFDIVFEDIIVHGIETNKKSYIKEAIKHIPPKNIIISANDALINRYDGITINIQHGIYWDILTKENMSEFRRKLSQIWKLYVSSRIVNAAQKSKNIVCVDYNYLNWFRAHTRHTDVKFTVIPNFTQLPNTLEKKPDNNINIVFARRFVEYRGTRIFTEAIKKILSEYPQVKVTFAGNGPDKEWISDKLKNYSNIEFIQYRCDESLDIHKDKHIAVVPSTGSEGTSLSLLEAMASGCAVICTNVGGMTNIVIDHYNGIIVNPEAGELYLAMKKLIETENLRTELGLRAYETAAHGFSKEKWVESWRKVIQQFY